MLTIQQAIDEEKQRSRILRQFEITAYEHEIKNNYTAVAIGKDGVALVYGPFVSNGLIEITILARSVCDHIKRIYLEKFDVVRLRRRYGDLATETTNGPSVSWHPEPILFLSIETGDAS